MRFSWEATAAGIADVYEELVRGPAPRILEPVAVATRA
jgi:hypothetical protein